jgi:hypothetical protein
VTATAGERRLSPSVPGRLLERVGELQHRELLLVAPHELQADRQALGREPAGTETAPATDGGHRRQGAKAFVTVAKAASTADALAGLERWKQRHPGVAARLAADDVLVDSMRGRSTTWTRIRVNLRHVPEEERPPAEPPDPDYDPWRAGSRAPKTRSSS